MKIEDTKFNFNKVVDQLPNPIMIFKNEQLVYANPSTYQLLGYEEYEEIFLKNLLPMGDYEKVLTQFQQVLTDRKSIVLKDITLRTKENKRMKTKLYASPSNHKHPFIQVYIQDTVYSAKLKQDFTDLQKKYQDLTNYISDVIAYYKQNGSIQYITPSVNREFGYKSDRLIGCCAFDFIHPQDRKRVEYIFRSLTYNTEQKQVRFRVRQNVGTYVWVESAFYRIEEEQGLYILANLKKIEKQIEAEKLAMQTEKLAMVGELSAGIVHEIKNPLTSIKGFLQLMQVGAIEMKDYINILKAEVDRIEAMAVNMLSFAKPHDSVDRHNLKDIIKDVFLLLDVQANKNNISLSLNEDVPNVFVKGDEIQLKQVLINLVKNAIEASHSNSKVEVKLAQDCRNGYIKVIDYGKGIPKRQLSKLGKSFYTTKEEGTGLGLMVSYRIIEHHHGQIKIDSKLGEGTTFTVWLPKDVYQGQELGPIKESYKSGT
ncbi:two-component system, sporulation sensor kinase A [Salinibacillus kushneri]|uniref:histidine kinase n=1 Tax=Salinibacillus kushneri TaxID=237682 RepID=A0A1I0DPL1_9BACI|nr:ATP-binding protein [Salinibacillus kushneri]SET33830.1 two-component system, sporulation sensor kinase A [Salinibacillus kushneri]